MIIRTINSTIRCHNRLLGNIAQINVSSPFRGYVRCFVAGKLNFHRWNFDNNKHISDFSWKNQRFFSDQSLSANTSDGQLSVLEFDKISSETLESLSDYFDELVEQAVHLEDADVSYRDGVLTIKFGDQYGTYVINKQTPNKQIWLSSPVSGPKRYDFVNKRWVYKHDGKSLHELLNEEIPKIVKSETSFTKCLYGS